MQKICREATLKFFWNAVAQKSLADNPPSPPPSAKECWVFWGGKPFAKRLTTTTVSKQDIQMYTDHVLYWTIIIIIITVSKQDIQVHTDHVLYWTIIIIIIIIITVSKQGTQLRTDHVLYACNVTCTLQHM